MRLALVAGALLAALAILLGLVLTREDDPLDFRGSEPSVEISMPDFRLEVGDGTLDSADLRGKAVAVTFLDTQCTDACPVVAAQMGKAIRLLGERREDVVALAISVDPANDTPESIAAFLTRFRAREEIRYVDAPESQLRKVWDDFDVLPSADTGDSNMHSVPVRVYDTDGRWRSTLHAGVDLSPANLAHDLETALDT